LTTPVAAPKLSLTPFFPGDTHVTTRHFATDHAYSDKRIELSHVVLAWLAGLPK
jgi:hypothetical protein